MTLKQNNYTGFVDSALLRTSSSGSLELALVGWLLDNDSAIVSLSFAITGKPPIPAALHDRPDVAAEVADIPHAARCGFRVTLPAFDHRSEYTVDFCATLASGLSLNSSFQVRPEDRTGYFQRTPSGETTESLPVPHSPVEVSPPQFAFGSQGARESLISILQIRCKSFLRSEARWSFGMKNSPSAPSGVDPGTTLPISVSIIIPIHNQAQLTFGCLEAIRSQMVSNVEVIIVDNGSSDDTSLLLSRMDGVVVIANARNVDYGYACNQGAQAARCQLLLFLNNDAFLLPGALLEAVQAFQKAPNVGAVGAKLIRPDGKLQEVGAFVLANGSTVARGRGSDPSHTLYSHPLCVDYCSAAFLLTSRETFLASGGFDSRYSPAYYEDVDYCCRLKSLGLICIVEPSAEVLHLERGSSATLQDADAMIERNREVFCMLHPTYGSQTTSHPPVREKKSSRDLTLFVIDDALPEASNGQGQGRAALLLAALLDLGVTVLFYPAGCAPGDPDGSAKRLSPLVAELFFSSKERSAARSAVVYPADNETEHAFIRRQAEGSDVVLVSRPHHMEQLQLALRSLPSLTKKPLVIYDAEALQAKRDILRLEVLQNTEMSDEEIVEIVSSEVVLAVDADRILTASDLEATTFIEFGFSPPVILGYGVKADPSPQKFDDRKNFLTVGPLLGLETPNVDGITWFLDSVMPPMKRLAPTKDAVLHAVGTCEVSELEQRQNSSFRLLGYLPDISHLYDRYRVFVAPTRFCAGISLKVIEAAALGIPIVTTPVVASQLGWRDEHEVMVGLNGYDFAAKCAALYSNEDLWLRLRKNALLRVSEQFSPEVFRKRAQDMLLDYWSPS